VESVYITALILALIITPPHTLHDKVNLEVAFWTSSWAMASKYILAIGKKHLFNPVAFGVAVTALALNASASWWVGTLPMLPFTLIGGLLITRKILRFDLVLSFLIVAMILIAWSHLGSGWLGIPAAWTSIAQSSLLFFAFVMLTEPLTTPPTRPLRIAYGALVGVLFLPSFHIGSLYSTPELALLAGNVFSYLVSPKAKLLLTLRKKEKAAHDTYDFWFDADKKMNFKPGQYLEWTLAHRHPDGRGNRRYFTVASSPTEKGIMMGVKFYPEGSSFKESLFDMKPGDQLIASQLAGDFTLPHDKKEKLVFVAGGIGVTPFRSQIQYLIDKNEKRDIVVFYSNRTVQDIAYADILQEAEEKLGIKTVYTLTDRASAPADWSGYQGYIDASMVRTEVPDYRDRHFCISGPQALVHSFEDTLRRLGVHESRITKDFFPGFA
jgi:ferredoxin-NADP reductase